MSDCAVIVGIEQYEVAAAPPLMGPCLDAIRFALWTLKQGIDADRIFLFLAKSDKWKGAARTQYEETLAALEKEGVQPRLNGLYDEILKVWTEELLPEPARAEGTLYLFWSGHGITLPEREQAMLCSGLGPGNTPTYLYLSEFQNSLRTSKYARFVRQRIILDSCATHVTPADLGAAVLRQPDKYDAVDEPGDQIVLTAVPVGKGAQAEEGSSLFSRVLLELLAEAGSWPDDIVGFFQKIEKAIQPQVPAQAATPRLVRVRSTKYEDIFNSGDRKRTAMTPLIMQILNQCSISIKEYGPIYRRTVGGMAEASGRMTVVSLPDMLDELADLPAELNGMSSKLVEFLIRITCGWPEDSKALADWLRKTISAAQRKTVEDILQEEEAGFCLAIIISESREGHNLFPASITALLCDAAFKNNPLGTLRVKDIADRQALAAEVCGIVLKMKAEFLPRKASLTVQVFTHPALMDPYHAEFVDDDKDMTLGHLHPFILRSRARLHGDGSYDLDGWRNKSALVRKLRSKDLTFYHESEGTQEARDRLSAINGLLSIRSVLAKGAAEEKDKPAAYKLLTAALKRGLPLVTWRIVKPEEGNWEVFEERLQEVLLEHEALGGAPQALCKMRSGARWARETVLLWDDEASLPAEHLREPPQG